MKSRMPVKVFYYLQPLFEAVAIAIKAVNFDHQAPDVAVLPVLIVRTGIERLSAPLTFDSIPMSERLNECADCTGTLVAVETRLETAVTFLMELERREAQAAPPLPDPELATRDMARDEVLDKLAFTARDLGWDMTTMGPKWPFIYLGEREDIPTLA